MAVYEQSRNAPFGAVVVLRAVETVERAIKVVKAKFIADRTYSQLSSLSESQLRDIGLADQDLRSYCSSIARRNV